MFTSHFTRQESYALFLNDFILTSSTNNTRTRAPHHHIFFIKFQSSFSASTKKRPHAAGKTSRDRVQNPLISRTKKKNLSRHRSLRTPLIFKTILYSILALKAPPAVIVAQRLASTGFILAEAEAVLFGRDESKPSAR